MGELQRVSEINKMMRAEIQKERLKFKDKVEEQLNGKKS